ncbi:hypothetical protein D0Z08_04760 [Nocardioides immobilis]|uniref:Uncharacterized protein n=2 Tax=Nocardioides immobilis TaxID=2049295 RepID=A0A417Y706_9ACTN|nr:hypothetical protein D0Z08_04760 [Nocardioides immobilis]
MKVVKPMTSNRDDGQPTVEHSPEQIAELFEIAGRETVAIRQLTGCVQQLQRAQEAKHMLSTLTPAEIRGALELRRLRVGEGK